MKLGTRPLAAATALLFVFGVLGLLTVDDDSGETRVSAAAAATTAQRTARIAMVVSFGSGALQPTTFAGEGELDMETGRVRMVLRPPGGAPVETVAIGTQAWLNKDGDWVVIDPQAAATGLGAGGFGGSSDPMAWFRFLQDEGAAGDIREKGVEDVRGTSTTRYAADLDVGRLFDVLGSKQAKAVSQLAEDIKGEVDVWVAGDDTVRRTVARVTIGRFVTTVTMELFDFGAPVDIQPPA